MLALITEQDLKEAIAECQGQRNPTTNTCIKLAAFLTIQKEMFGNSEQPEAVQPFNSYSYSADNKEKIVDYPNGILFDDEEVNRKNWSGQAYDVNNIIEVLKGLN